MKKERKSGAPLLTGNTPDPILVGGFYEDKLFIQLFISSFFDLFFLFSMSKQDILSITMGTKLRLAVKNNVKLGKVCTRSGIIPNISFSFFLLHPE